MERSRPRPVRFVLHLRRHERRRTAVVRHPALADQKAGHRVGWLNPTLYSLARTKNPYSKDFHDITDGNNIVDVGELGGRSGAASTRRRDGTR